MIAPMTIPLLEPSTPSSSSTQSPSPSTVTPSCLSDSDLCHFVFEKTQQLWLAESSYWIIIKPARIILIIALALIARHLAHRAIDRVIKHTVDPDSSTVFSPLRDRISPALRMAAEVLPSDRKRQRAEALGSVLRSVSSTVVLAVATMLVLAELGVNLGPILASAGIAGIAIGFGAQNLVKDFLAGMFILFEDQFGVGDGVELGQLGGTVTGTVEAVGLRITTVRDDLGAVWYIRNGEIIRVGNQSQGWTLVVVDVQVKFPNVAEASRVLGETAKAFSVDPDWDEQFITPPEVLGIEEITSEATILRTTVKTTPEHHKQLARELRHRIAEALNMANLLEEQESISQDTDPDN